MKNPNDHLGAEADRPVVGDHRQMNKMKATKDKQRTIFRANGFKLFRSKEDYRMDGRTVNPEMRLGFSIAGPLAVQGLASDEPHARAIYLAHNSVCPACNLYRAEREFNYGKFSHCAKCRTFNSKLN